MRYVFIVLCALVLSATSAFAQISIGIGLPGVSIGINVPLYPNLVPVPGYPVYYAPGMNSNYFFYDGMYWVYERDNWYASYWYNGPWSLVAPQAVPLFVLRVPVRYYREPPVYFRGWRPDAPPRWDEHWGNEWAQQHSGWDRWNHASAPRPAPLPSYQRQYSGNRYPGAEEQRALHGQNYRYQPKEPVVQQHYQAQAVQRAPAPVQRGQQEAPQVKGAGPHEVQRSRTEPTFQQNAPVAPREQAPTQARPQEQRPPVQQQSRPPQQGVAPREQPAQRPAESVQKPAPAQARPQEQRQPVQPQQGPAQREQAAQRPGQERAPQAKPAQRQEQQKGEERKGEEHK